MCTPLDLFASAPTLSSRHSQVWSNTPGRLVDASRGASKVSRLEPQAARSDVVHHVLNDKEMRKGLIQLSRWVSASRPVESRSAVVLCNCSKYSRVHVIFKAKKKFSWRPFPAAVCVTNRCFHLSLKEFHSLNSCTTAELSSLYLSTALFIILEEKVECSFTICMKYHEAQDFRCSFQSHFILLVHSSVKKCKTVEPRITRNTDNVIFA